MTRFNTQSARFVVIAAGLSALTACSAEQGYGSSFFQEAGSQIESGGNFGNATLHNLLVQSCRANGSGIGKAGAVAGDPVVVLDPASTPTRQVYRVHCDGNLDGKYAAVVYDGYIQSAESNASVTEAEAETSE